MDISTVIFSTGLLIFIAHLFSSLFERTRIPDVLPLVLIGLLVGPILGFVSPDAFGQVGNVFISITLIIILFESGLGLDFSTLRTSLSGGVKLTVINFILTSSILAITATGMGLSLLEGMILGAILGGTSSAVVIPLIEKIRLHNGSKTILLLESTFSDVLCIVVTLALLQTVIYDEVRPGAVLGQIIASFFLAAVIGGIFAIFWSYLLAGVRRLENSIFLTPAFVFIIYGITEGLGYSGAISSLAFGVTLGNIRSITLKDNPLFKLPQMLGGIIKLRPISLNEKEKAFFAEVVFLLKTFFFVYLGLSITLHNVNVFILGFIVTLLTFLIRIVVIRVSFNKEIPKQDAALASVITPKGLAAAVLATLPVQAGLANGLMIQDIVYAVILFSIISTAVLSFLVERRIITHPYDYVFTQYAAEKIDSK